MPSESTSQRNEHSWARKAACLQAICALFIHTAACASPDALPNSELVSLHRFPEQEGLVVHGGGAFVKRGDGFATQPRGPVRGMPQRIGEPIDIVLPPGGGEPVVFQGAKSGFLMKLYEVGVSGEPRREGNALWYARPDGRSYWSANHLGVEEWLLIDGAFVERDAPVARWDIEGAMFRQSGGTVEVLDEAGRPRIQVSAPEGYGRDGRKVALRLSGAGTRLELFVDAAGETVLLDPRWVLLGAAMNVARMFHTATVLQDGRVLVTGGEDGSFNFLDSAEMFDPETETFSLLPQGMSTARSRHTATLLPSGQVLIAGGLGDTSAELFDPSDDAFKSSTTMNYGHGAHTATLLQDGSVLVAGGFTNQAELYHPAQNTWETVMPLSGIQAYHSAVRLEDGRVLVTGGIYFPTMAEIYDPASKAWTAATSMGAPRFWHSSVLLPGGKVLVIGGIGDGTFHSAVELYDPALNIWLPRMPGPPSTRQSSFLQPDGRVFVALPNGSAVYDPKLDQWSEGTDGQSFHLYGAAVELLNGQILNIGGDLGGLLGVSPQVERYDPSQGAWITKSALSEYKGHHTATLLQDGSVLFSGGLPGFGNSATATAERYEPATGINTVIAPMNTARYDHTATALNSGEVLICGGSNESQSPLGSVEMFDPKTGAWQGLPNMSMERAEHTATLLPNGDVLVTGGFHASGQGLSEAERFIAGTKQWIATKPMHHARGAHTATLLPNGRLLVSGGRDGLQALNSAEIFDPATAQWTETAPMNTARYAHRATLTLPEGKVLITGGVDASNASMNQAELFDPTTGIWTAVGPMKKARSRHISAQLPDGGLIIAGDSPVVEFFDRATLSFQKDEEVILLLQNMASLLLPSGQLLVSGGNSDAYIGSGIILYDPASRWRNSPAMNQARADASATLLDSGDILVTGGQGRGGFLATAERFYATSSHFAKTGAMNQARSSHRTLPLPGGDALVFGGIGPAGYLAQTERWQAGTGQWIGSGDLNQARAYFAGVRMKDGRLLAAGGWGPNGILSSAEAYDPTLGAWTLTKPMPSARWKAKATVLDNGMVLISGGLGTDGALNSAVLYVPTAGAWLNAGTYGNGRVGHTATLLSNGHVLLAGGADTPSAVVFDPATLQWTSTGPMLALRSEHTAALLANGQVLAAGGAGPNGSLKSAELYDPASNQWKTVRELNVPRRNAWAFTLGDGSVLTAGGAGVSDEPIALAEVFRLSETGALCIHAADCQSGFCVDGVCCNTACDGGPCDGCSVLTGSKQSGLCTQFNGLACDDGLKCTENDTCQLGQCKGSIKSCGAPNECHETPGCLEATGQCAEAKPKANGTPCNEGDKCAVSSYCAAGECKITTKICPAPNGCHEEGFCHPSTGECFNPLKGDGIACEDGVSCTEKDHCEAGVCIGSPILCPAIDVCYEPGVCEEATGQCPTPVPRDNGSLCNDGNPCTEGDACGNGSCVGKEVLCDCQGCGAYRCFGSPTHCLDTCASVLECSPGFVCDRGGRCVSPPASNGVAEAGCSYNGKRGTWGHAIVVSLLMAMALGRSKRRGGFTGLFSALFLLTSGCEWVASVDRERVNENSDTSTCGNGVADPMERCDDGNREGGDGCSAACLVEAGFECGSALPSACKAICGDGLIAGPESCDDGNQAGNDGCSPDCTLETGYECKASPSQCKTVCGDGLVAGLEECDDQNTANNDGCSSACEQEIGWKCYKTNPSVCVSVCGNGEVDGNEECDDGNKLPDDGCSNQCVVEVGWRCTNLVSPTYCEDVDECEVGTAQCNPHNSVCKNLIGAYTCECLAGYKKYGKSCQDIDECALGTDACDINASCGNTPGGYLCTCKPGSLGNGWFCSPVCGDGIVMAGEECDDGNFQTGDGCSGACAIESGYACGGTPSVCADIDECALGTHGCDINAACINLMGSHQCVCGPGYLGDGLTCEDLNECNLYPFPCSPLALCSNAEGGFQCVCKAGFEGDGFTCIDIDECALQLDDCIHSECLNEYGSYTCGFCDPGYSGYGINCSPGCGDGVITGLEVCDDGNVSPGDGCNPNCALEPNANCVGEPSQCSICGDGVVNGTEVCDDGNLSNCDSCSSNCQPTQISSAGPSLSLPIPDGVFDGSVASMTCATLTVPPLSGSGLLQHLCVEVGIEHPRHRQLAIAFVHAPGGAFAYYPTGGGVGLSASYPIRFEDGAPVPWFDMGLGLSGNQVICRDDGICDYQPDLPFSSWALGQPAVGDWKICVGDASGGDTGTLESVKLYLQD